MGWTNSRRIWRTPSAISAELRFSSMTPTVHGLSNLGVQIHGFKLSGFGGELLKLGDHAVKFLDQLVPARLTEGGDE